MKPDTKMISETGDVRHPTYVKGTSSSHDSSSPTVVAESVVDQYCAAYPQRNADEDMHKIIRQQHPWIGALVRDDKTDAHLIRRICTTYLDAADVQELPDYMASFWNAESVMLIALGHPNCPPEVLSRACRSRNLYYAETAAEKDRTPDEDKVYVLLLLANVDRSVS